MKINPISPINLQNKKEQNFNALIKPNNEFKIWVQKTYKNDKRGFTKFLKLYNAIKKEQANNKLCDIQLFIGKNMLGETAPTIKVVAKESGSSIYQFDLDSEVKVQKAIINALKSANYTASYEIKGAFEYAAENMPPKYISKEKPFIFLPDYMNKINVH